MCTCLLLFLYIADLSSIYVSGWQCSSTASSTNEPGPDFADYPMNTVPNKCKILSSFCCFVYDIYISLHVCITLYISLHVCNAHVHLTNKQVINLYEPNFIMTVVRTRNAPLPFWLGKIQDPRWTSLLQL